MACALEKSIVELRKATSQAFGEVNKSVHQISEGINLTRKNVQQNSDAISNLAGRTHQAIDEIYGRIGGLEKAFEQLTHTQENFSARFKKKWWKGLKTLSQKWGNS